MVGWQNLKLTEEHHVQRLVRNFTFLLRVGKWACGQNIQTSLKPVFFRKTHGYKIYYFGEVDFVELYYCIVKKNEWSQSKSAFQFRLTTSVAQSSRQLWLGKGVCTTLNMYSMLHNFASTVPSDSSRLNQYILGKI